MKTDRITKHILWQEMARLCSAMKEDGNRLYLLIYIQSFLGLRIGDVLSLRWQDFSNTELTISEKKTGKKRRMRVNPQLQELVNEEYENHHSGVKKSRLIFENKLRTGAISIGYVNRMLKVAFKKYKVDADQVSSHVFRKTWSYKILSDNDFSDKAIFLVSRMLNHSSVATTMRYLLLDQRESDLAYEGLKI